MKTFLTAQLTGTENSSPPQGGTSPDMTQLLLLRLLIKNHVSIQQLDYELEISIT